MIGFTEKHRAREVLQELQRLRFDWCAELNNAIAVEVEKDSRLRLLYGDLLDPGAGWEEASPWRPILNAIVPLPHIPPPSRREGSWVNAESSAGLGDFTLDRDFVRNAAALLRPGRSAILAILHEWMSALNVLSGYSPLVLHTQIVRSGGASEIFL